MRIRMTIRGRLAALAGLALLGLGLLAALAVWSGQVNRGALIRLYEQDIESLVQLQRAEIALGDVRFRAAGVLLEQMPVPGALNHVRGARKELAELWQGLQPLAAAALEEAEARAMFQALEAGWPKVDAVLAKLEAGYTAKDRQALAAVLEDEWPALHQAAVKPLQALIPLTRGAAAAGYGQAVARSRTLLTLGIGAALACIAALAVMAWFTMRSVLQPLREVEGAMSRIAEGDLAAPLPAARADELGRTIAALAHMRDRLQALVVDVRDATSAIENASAEVASGSHDLSSRTERAASSLQQTAASMEQITGTVQQSAAAARQAHDLAGGAAAVAGRGGQVVGQVVATMGEINGASRRIADIIGVIDGIAFQTNILALNAAVEAARAGEQGRGFAVVAGEVRSLAQRSAEAAREIKDLIGGSVEKVDAGMRLVADAGSTMDEIVSSVRRVSDIVAEMSAASGQQSAGIGQVNGSVNHLDEMTQQNAALVEESAAAAESLREQARRLAGLVATFRLEPQAA